MRVIETTKEVMYNMDELLNNIKGKIIDFLIPTVITIFFTGLSFLFFYLYEIGKLSYYGLVLDFNDILNNWSLLLLVNLFVHFLIMFIIYLLIKLPFSQKLYVEINFRKKEKEHSNKKDFCKMLFLSLGILILLILNYILFSRKLLVFNYNFFQDFVSYTISVFIVLLIMDKFTIKPILLLYQDIKGECREDKNNKIILMLITFIVMCIIIYAHGVSISSNNQIYNVNPETQEIVLYRSGDYYIMSGYYILDDSIIIDTKNIKYRNITDNENVIKLEINKKKVMRSNENI